MSIDAIREEVRRQADRDVTAMETRARRVDSICPKDPCQICRAEVVDGTMHMRPGTVRAAVAILRHEIGGHVFRERVCRQCADSILSADRNGHFTEETLTPLEDEG